ncbi:RING-H2 FINGER PROTEIN ATL20-LIKE [Salix viminalis]|uniref:RING-type E3 ubiquitin transferase n=1 Tax=Salix viminalis TaxID=40686 RepID=A0A9Q0QBA4_SALVM|nr:RING-H2 FINGER PROTEIN ATL20-LIKE [Salix viminalis]
MAASTLSLLILSVLVFLQKAHSNKTTCHNPCSRNKLEVRFPFGFDNNRCSYPGFNLSCNDLQNQMILNLPNTGNFTVLNINYRSQTVTIKDPQNCLPQKFMNSSFDLSESPFIPELHDPFLITFLNCSSNSTTDGSELRHIKCLSNENFTVVAMLTFIYESSSYRRVPSCTELKTRVAVPVVWYRSDSVTRLKWNVPYCRSCEEDGGTCGFKGDTGMAIECIGQRSNGPLPRSAKYGIILGAGIPGLLCIVGIGSYLFGRLKEYIGGNQPTTELSTSISPGPSVLITGLDAPTIESYPKTQLGDSGRLPRPNDNTCPICLSEYQPKDTLRTIPDCSHYFHANCVDEWLKMNATCPLCRKSPDGSSVMTPSSPLSTSSSSTSTPLP